MNDNTDAPLIVYPDAGDDAKSVLVGERLARLQRLGRFEVHYGRPTSVEAYVERIRDASAILLGWDLPAEIMSQAQKLEVVSFTGIGAAKFVDLDAAARQGVTVCNCPGYSDVTVAEHTIGLMLAVARNTAALDASMRRGEWSPSMGIQLAGKQLGIIGLGGIGAQVARLANALGMNVVAWTRNPSDERAERCGVRFVPIDELLRTSDVVSMHVASNESTAGFLDRERLALMRPESIFINTARAEVVDEAAMVEALQAGALRGAGIDVFSEEPLSANHPLRAMENVVITPHVAYLTPEAEVALFDIGIDNLVNYYNDEPRNVVTGLQSESRNQALARAYVEASSAHDLEAIGPMLNENLVYQSASVGEFNGREEALEMMSAFFTQFPDVHWEVAVYRDMPDGAVEFDFVISHTDASSNVKMSREGHERLEFDEHGLMTRVVVGPRA